MVFFVSNAFNLFQLLLAVKIRRSSSFACVQKIK